MGRWFRFEQGRCMLQETEEAAVGSRVQGCSEEAVAQATSKNTIASLG